MRARFSGFDAGTAITAAMMLSRIAVDMEPCTGTDGNCPSYGSQGDFKVAIETPKGKLPDGPLTACPA